MPTPRTVTETLTWRIHTERVGDNLRRKTLRAGFGKHVYQSEHSHRTLCVIILIQ